MSRVGGVAPGAAHPGTPVGPGGRGGTGAWDSITAVTGACHATHTPLSTNGAPQLSLHAACAAPTVRHIEWFVDHVKVERMLFDGAQEIRAGWLAPDRDRPGHGLALRVPDASEYRVAS